MNFEPLDDRYLHHLEHSPASQTTPASSTSSSTSSPSLLFLSDVSETPLKWLWPGRIPLGHLTLLDAAPGSDPSLFALTLAACISSGSALPGATPTQPGCVILYAPYDSASATLKPRLQAAGGDPGRVLLYRPSLAGASHTTPYTRSLALPGDLDHMATIIRFLEAQLVILDLAGAIPGLSRCLPAFFDLAQQTNCAILLIRSLPRPLANPLRSLGPTSPLHDAVSSRLLLTPDPSDERHHLLIPVRHSLSPQPPILTYDLHWSEAGIPTIHWLGERDHTRLARLSTGPLHSPHRQAILRFLQNSACPQSIPDILVATSYDPEAGRQMLVRMKMAGELVSPARGLYTTPDHPSLLSLPIDPLPVQNVTTTSVMPWPAVPDATTDPDTPSFPVPEVTTLSSGTESNPEHFAAGQCAINPGQFQADQLISPTSINSSPFQVTNVINPAETGDSSHPGNNPDSPEMKA